MQSTTFNWTTSDGLKIHGHHWKVEDAKAAVGFVHGMGEHGARYAHVAAAFAEAGIASMAYDRRGHGQSEGKRGHTISYQAFIDEIKSLVKHLREAYGEIPVFLYGHSMGGNLVLHYLIHEVEGINGVVASAPWIELAFKPSPAKIHGGRIVRSILPALSMKNDLDPAGLSRDPAEVQAYIDDPLVHNRITPNTGVYMLAQADALNAYQGEVQLPLLIMHGTEDRIISFSAAKAFAHRVKGRIEFKAWEGSYHEAHNDLDKEEVIDYAKNWLANHI